MADEKNQKDAQKFMDEQNAALQHYRLTGEAGVYVDPTRDQEPDIAPELGVAPHPELANPAPPASSFSGRALAVEANPVLVPVEEKEKNAEEATEAFNEALQENEELAKKGEPFSPPGADESAKTAAGDPEAQKPQDFSEDKS